jgi:phosphoheptose isomerase
MTADTRQDVVADGIRRSVAVLEQLLDPERLGAIAQAADVITASLRHGGKLLVFGNGGSASDA